MSGLFPWENARLRDTIEEQDKQIEALKRDVLEKTADARKLRSEVERLTKAGDELHVFLISYIVENRISSLYLNKLDDDWNAAKEGKGHE